MNAPGTARKQRAAFISQGLGGINPPNADGSVSIWTYETVRHLVRHEQVLLLEFGTKPFGTSWLKYGGATYAYLPTALNRVINAVQHRVSGWLRRRWSNEQRRLRPEMASRFHNYGFALLAAWHARRWRCAVIHIQNFTQFAPVVRALNPRARIVLHMHCEWLSQLDPRMIERRLQAVDVVVGCSGYIVRKALERMPQLQPKCQTVYNGSDVERFVPSANVSGKDAGEPLRILFVGRISPEKGVHVLAEAFTLVGEKFPTARLELVGGLGSLPAELLVALSQDPLVQGLAKFYGGDYVAQVRSRIPPRLADRITFHGNLSHQELSGHYGRATVFVNASLSDAFPVPVIEAMAAGLPMAASAVGGIPEAVVHETTGLLVEPNNSAALAAALIRLLGDAQLRRRMGLAARERAVRLFSWQAIADQVAWVHGADGEETVLAGQASPAVGDAKVD